MERTALEFSSGNFPKKVENLKKLSKISIPKCEMEVPGNLSTYHLHVLTTSRPRVCCHGQRDARQVRVNQNGRDWR